MDEEKIAILEKTARYIADYLSARGWTIVSGEDTLLFAHPFWPDDCFSPVLAIRQQASLEAAPSRIEIAGPEQDRRRAGKHLLCRLGWHRWNQGWFRVSLDGQLGEARFCQRDGCCTILIWSNSWKTTRLISVAFARR